MTMDVHSLYRDVLAGARVDRPLAAWLFRSDGAPLEDLVYCAGRLRNHFFGTKVHLCAIINAKSGRCDQDCRFCAQSGRYRTGSPTYPLVSAERCLAAALDVERFGVRCFSIVTSGKAIESPKEIDTVKAAIAAIREKTHLEVAASLGTLSLERLRELKEAGLSTYHHNPETSPGFYPEVCTTHRLEERIKTIVAAKEAGLQVCGGGIFGMGEDAVQRAEFAVLLRELPVSRIPVNFLNPIAGTPLGNREPPRPLECLRIIAALRFVVPDKEIVICGGRQVGLRSLQPLVFQAGANGVMTGDYLTTKGQEPAADIEMIRDLGLEISACGTGGGVPARP